jgi:hypothetical protein
MYDFSTSFVLCIWIYGNKNDDDDDDENACSSILVKCFRQLGFSDYNIQIGLAALQFFDEFP